MGARHMTAGQWRTAVTTTAGLFFIAGVAATLWFVGTSGSCAHWAGNAERIARPAVFAMDRGAAQQDRGW